MPRFDSEKFFNVPLEMVATGKFQSLFRRPLPDFPALQDNRAVDAQPSRLFAGYGFGILNNKADETAIAFTYGKHYAHYHWDYLNIEVFAGGQKMMPDLGYPDAMNAFVPERFIWSQHTVSHNTVMVDKKRKDNNSTGVLHDFADGYDKPRAKNHIVKYLICTRKTDSDSSLKSTFTSVWETYKGEQKILTDTRLTNPDKGAGHVVVVQLYTPAYP